MVMQTIRVTAFSLLLIILTGFIYPMAMTAMAQRLFPHQANGSLIEKDGNVIGSELIAQNFTGEGYFHPRPSAAGAGYEANNSGASNLSVTSKKLHETFQERIAAEKAINGVANIPVDMVTASGSGLDPHISPDAARYQSARIAKVRNIDPFELEALISEHTEGRSLGFIGMPRVNVLALNLALDKMAQEQITHNTN